MCCAFGLRRYEALDTKLEQFLRDRVFKRAASMTAFKRKIKTKHIPAATDALTKKLADQDRLNMMV